MLLKVSILLAGLLSSAYALPPPSRRAETKELADGKTLEYGMASSGLQWQSSGVLYQGCNSSHEIDIADCYALSLTSDPNEELDSGYKTPRQRIEFLTRGANDGESFAYTWKYYLSADTGTSNHFFHLMQILSRGDGGPIVTLDAVNGKAAITDIKRDCANTHCPTVDLKEFAGRTTEHTMYVTYGPNGRLFYVVKVSGTGQTLLSYDVTGEMGSESTSLKFGTYRATYPGMTSASAALGDFTSVSRSS